MKEAHFLMLQFLFERIDKETKKLYLYTKLLFIIIAHIINHDNIKKAKHQKSNKIFCNYSGHIVRYMFIFGQE